MKWAASRLSSRLVLASSNWSNVSINRYGACLPHRLRNIVFYTCLNYFCLIKFSWAKSTLRCVRFVAINALKVSYCPSSFTCTTMLLIPDSSFSLYEHGKDLLQNRPWSQIYRYFESGSLEASKRYSFLLFWKSNKSRAHRVVVRSQKSASKTIFLPRMGFFG